MGYTREDLREDIRKYWKYSNQVIVETKGCRTVREIVERQEAALALQEESRRRPQDFEYLTVKDAHEIDARARRK